MYLITYKKLTPLFFLFTFNFFTNTFLTINQIPQEISLFSYHLINVVKLDLKILFSIAASVVDTAGFNPNGIKTFLPDVLSTFSLKGNQLIHLFYATEF